MGTVEGNKPCGRRRKNMKKVPAADEDAAENK